MMYFLNYKVEPQTMMRGLMILIALTMVFTVVSITTTFAATLKSTSIVTDRTLKLGDVFDGLTQNANYVLGNAPQPGQDMVLNSRTLYRIAVAMDLGWRPAHNNEQVTIRRAATVVPFKDVKAQIHDALIEEGIESNFQLALYSETSDLVLPHTETASAELEGFEFDPQNDTFRTVIVAPSSANPLIKIPVSGKIERLIQVPVMRNAIRSGDIIGQTDIDWIEIPQKRLQHDLIMRSDKLIGMTPRRALFAGKPILDNELERPQIVARGETVTIFYKDGPIKLSAKGKALQNGAIGDMIRISNLNSSKSVQGLITNTREVTVQ